MGDPVDQWLEEALLLPGRLQRELRLMAELDAASAAAAAQVQVREKAFLRRLRELQAAGLPPVFEGMNEELCEIHKMQRQSRALMREKVEVNRHVASALHAEQQILAGERQRLLLTLNCGGGGSSSTTAPGGGGLSSHGELATQSGAGDPAGGSGGGSWLSRSFARKKLGFGEKAATAGSAGGSASTGGGSVTLMHGGGGGADRSAAGAHSSLLSLSASSHHHHATSFAAPPQQHPHHAAWQSAPSHNPPSSGNNNPTPPQHARPPAQQASPHSATGVAGGPTAERSLRHVHSGGHSQSGALTLSSSSGAHPPLAAQHHQPHHHQPHHQQSASMAPHLSQSLAAQSRLPNAFSVGAVAGNRRQSELGGEAGEKAEGVSAAGARSTRGRSTGGGGGTSSSSAATHLPCAPPSHSQSHSQSRIAGGEGLAPTSAAFPPSGGGGGAPRRSRKTGDGSAPSGGRLGSLSTAASSASSTPTDSCRATGGGVSGSSAAAAEASARGFSGGRKVASSSSHGANAALSANPGAPSSVPSCSEGNAQSRRPAKEERSAAESGEVWEGTCPICLKGEASSDVVHMVACDSCNLWFHFECVGYSSTMEDEAWFCPQCCRGAQTR